MVMVVMVSMAMLMLWLRQRIGGNHDDGTTMVVAMPLADDGGDPH